MKIRKRIQAFTLACVTALSVTGGLVGSCVDVKAADGYWPSNVTLSSADEAAVVMDVTTGTVLYNVNGDVKHYPASITKILTALLALENTNLEDEVTFSHEAVFGIDAGSSSIARDEGEIMTMEECLYGMMLESANECAYAIAEYTGGGDYDTFIQMMNDRAKELGCTSTHFTNANGLPDEDHYTSAYDMALISSEAYRNDTFAKITGTKSYSIPPTNKHDEVTPLNNHHAMLNYYQTSKYLYDYCVGGKTGYTTAANSTLVTYAKKDNMTLVCVVMNANSPAQYTDTRTLLDYCFDNFTTYDVSQYADLFSEETKDKAGTLNADLDLITVDEGYVILPKTVDFSEASVSIEPDDDDSDDVVGRISYSYGNRYVGGADLLYTENEEVSSYPFHNVDEEDGGSSVKYIRLDYKIILYVLLALALLAAITEFLKLKSGRILLWKSRRIDSKRKKKSKYRTIKRAKRRKKRRKTIK